MSGERGHILSLRGLDVSYGGVRAVRDVTLDVAPGEIVGIVGESGSGKSTVLRAIAGLLPPAGRVTGGSIVFEGRDLGPLGAKERAALRRGGIAYVFQNPTQSLDPLFRIGAQFDECLQAHGMADRSEMRSLERAVLAEMGFDDVDRVLGSYPHELSGGMCQRVVLAMSVACEPRLMLADEPTSALDVVSQQQVSNLLLRMRQDHGVAIVIVSHNIGAVALVSDRIGVMYHGQLVEVGERDRVLASPEHPYTRNLIAAIPRTDGSLPQVPEHWEGE